MKINYLKINQFGKLKNKEINLENNINLIYGKNEAGKTTLLKALTGLVKVDFGSKATLDLTTLNDKRTLNRFAGPKMTDKLLDIFGTSELVFEKLKGTEEHYSLEYKNFKFLNSKKFANLKMKYQKYAGGDLLKIPAHNCIMYGVAHVPEGRQVFANLTVQENLEMGAYRRHNTSKIKEDLKEVFERFPRLEERKKQDNYYNTKNLMKSSCKWYGKDDLIPNSELYLHCLYVCRKSNQIGYMTDGKIEVIYQKGTKLAITILKVKEKFLPINQYIKPQIQKQIRSKKGNKKSSNLKLNLDYYLT